MLEALILNQTQRLLAQSPYFAGNPKWTLMHSEAYSGSKYGFVSNTPGQITNIYNDLLDVFLFSGANAGNPLYRFSPEAWFLGNAAVVADTSLQIWQLVTDPQGRTWGVLNNSSGVDGLYLRAASVGTPAWTRVIAAANGASLSLHKRTNGDIWFHDATAGNWYLLQNGTAGSASVSAPAGLQTWTPYYTARWNIDFVMPDGDTLNNWLSCAGHDLTQANIANAESSTWSNKGSIYDNSAAASQATLKGRVPMELLMQAANGSATVINSIGAVTLRLNSKYTAVFVQNTGSTGFQPRVTVALLNKNTWAIKYLGCFEWSAALGGSNGANQCGIRGARLKDGNLDIFMTGTMQGSSTYAGLLFVSIPLKPLDF